MREYEITRLNFVLKVFFGSLVLLAVYATGMYIIGEADDLGLLNVLGLDFVSLSLFSTSFLYKMRYSENGIDYILGIIKEDGTVLGHIKSKPWDDEWSYTIDDCFLYFIPRILPTLNNKLTPFSFINNIYVVKNFSGACRMIYKYQVILTANDKKLLIKYGKITKEEQKEMRTSDIAKRWDRIPEDLPSKKVIKKRKKSKKKR